MKLKNLSFSLIASTLFVAGLVKADTQIYYANELIYGFSQDQVNACNQMVSNLNNMSTDTLMFQANCYNSMTGVPSWPTQGSVMVSGVILQAKVIPLSQPAVTVNYAGELIYGFSQDQVNACNQMARNLNNMSTDSLMFQANCYNSMTGVPSWPVSNGASMVSGTILQVKVITLN